MNYATNGVYLSLILPCYNEAEHIEQSVPEIIRLLDEFRWSYEIIFVDDLSSDNTIELIRQLFVRYPEHRLALLCHSANMGRGQTVSDGFRAAAGEIVGYIDIDLEVHPHYIASCLLSLRGGADFCVGHRIYQLRLHNLNRHILSRAYTMLVRTVLGLPYRDTEAGYKFMRREVALDLLQYTQDPGWFWDTEIMFYAHRLGYKVAELPCLFIRRKDKTSTVKPLRDSIRYLQSLNRFRQRTRFKTPTR